MKQIAPLVHAWSRHDPARHLDLHGLFLQARPGEPGALIDPVPFGDGDEEHVRELGGATAVVLTQEDHRRTEGERLAQTLGCPVLLAGGAGELPSGLASIPLPTGAALVHAPSGSAIPGPSVTGAPAGELSLTDASSGTGASTTARALRALLAYPVQRVLVSSGEHVLGHAEDALQSLIYRHDPAAFLVRPDDLVWQAPRVKGTRFARRSAEYSRLVGLQTLDFEAQLVPPGKQSTLMHRHDGAEELFIILEGEGEVETEQGTFPLRAGDVLAFPPRFQVAHGIRNTGASDLRFLAFGATAGRATAVDYPQSGKVLTWADRRKSRLFYLPENTRVDYWEGERTD
jgi:uncharacterized cupin superfamily protein